MTAFDQRADSQERIAVARFEDASESNMDVGRKRPVLVPIKELICRRRGKLGRRRYFRLMQRSSHKGKHAPVDVAALDLRDDVGLKIRDQLVCVSVAAIGAITQMLEQPLEQKQITDREPLIVAGRRHVASRAGESREDFARGAFAVPLEGIIEWGRPPLGDRLGDPSRVLIRRRGFWLGSAHRGASANHLK
ncbi:MAG: hypothetical protein ABI196_05765 [Bradyrhizobium sp.]